MTEARSRVSETLAAMDEVDQNPDLTVEGKTKERTRLAEKTLAEFDKSEALEKARASVAYVQARWAAKVDEVIKPAEDLHGVTLHSQIRDRVAGMSREDRFKFLQQHGDDELVASALLTAPSFISNLSESEAALIRSKLEKLALSPEVIEAEDANSESLGRLRERLDERDPPRRGARWSRSREKGA